MIKIEAKKDGKGNIIISEDSFEMVLACLDNQKFVGESPQNGDSVSVGEDKYWRGQEDIQNAIDYYNRECRKILHQKYILRTESDGYFLVKRYEYQKEDTEWTGEDVGLVYELFKDTKIIYNKNIDLLSDCSEEYKNEDIWKAVEAEQKPWLIERPLRYDYQYLTISEDGKINRPWRKDEIERITEILNIKRLK